MYYFCITEFNIYVYHFGFHSLFARRKNAVALQRIRTKPGETLSSRASRVPLLPPERGIFRKIFLPRRSTRGSLSLSSGVGLSSPEQLRLDSPGAHRKRRLRPLLPLEEAPLSGRTGRHFDGAFRGRAFLAGLVSDRPSGPGRETPCACTDAVAAAAHAFASRTKGLQTSRLSRSSPMPPPQRTAADSTERRSATVASLSLQKPTPSCRFNFPKGDLRR